jgi:hypothetical protein
MFGGFRKRQAAGNESHGVVSSIQEGQWHVGRIDFPYVDRESQTRSGQSCDRFFVRPPQEPFWLYGKIAGHKPQTYEEALEIVRGLKSTAQYTG